ncbi:hypothetical protein [Hoeflea sp. BAL378]|uniref:hypothetical protein n=1 Tax=Hoeflea sp. BAL378 TaxID=1547437 RepID=UPI00126A77FA|nr:hypothetical protein [Hoeflea sp. BAL378]
MDHPQPIRFFEFIVDQLRDSDIIIGFSTNNLLGFLNNAAGFRDALFNKIDNRTPFYLQFLQMWEIVNLFGSGMSRSMTESYADLLDKLKVYPTGIQVRGFSNGHTMSFEPAKVDPCLSAVFEDGEKTWIDGANLMRFGEGTTALLKSSANHRNVSTLDPSAGLIDYEKLSPFVVRSTDDHFGYLVSGIFFAVNFYSATNPSSVGRANVTAISKIVRELQSNVRVPAVA